MQDVHWQRQGTSLRLRSHRLDLSSQELTKVLDEFGIDGRATIDRPEDLIDYELAGRLALGLGDPDWSFLAVSDFSAANGVRLGERGVKKGPEPPRSTSVK